MRHSTLVSTATILTLASTGAWASPDPATSPIRVGGFVDGQAHYNQVSSAAEGFVINDGAIYVSKEIGAVGARIDIPFRTNADAAGANADPTDDGANFTIGRQKAQAFVTYKHDFGLTWKAGQWDTIYGTELNDTADIVFTRQGLLFNGFMPLVHTGVHGSYEVMPGLAVNALVANERDQGAKRDRNLEWGAQLAYSRDWLRFAAGTLMGRQSGESLPLYDLLAGVTFGRLSLDVQFDIRKPGPGLDNATGLMGMASYGLSDDLNFAVRAERTDKLGSSDQTQLTVGPQYSLSKELRLKADWTHLIAKDRATGTSAKNNSAAVALVYKL